MKDEGKPIDVILKVLVTLDYLKLYGDQESAMGDGAPINVVAMPDFVVDVDGAPIAELNKRSQRDPLGMRAPAEVGSRAGRLIFVLSHLRDLDDESFQLHYITKTGLPGKAVLQDRLNAHLRTQNLQPLRFSLLTPGAQTRYAILHRTERVQTNRDNRNILFSSPDELLRVEDLTRHFYRPIDVIRHANALYFATDSIDQFCQLVRVAVLGRAQGTTPLEGHAGGAADRTVFVDVSALAATGSAVADANDESKAIDALVHAAGELSEDDRTSICVILEDRGTNTPPERLFDRVKLHEARDSIFSYNYNTKTLHWTKCPGLPITPELPWQRHEVYAREGFIAGLVLYSAVASAWTGVRSTRLPYPYSYDSTWDHQLVPAPIDKNAPETCWGPREALSFAGVLCALWKKLPNNIPDRRELLRWGIGQHCPTLVSDANLAIDGILSTKLQKDWILFVNLAAHEWLRGNMPATAKQNLVQRLFKTATFQDAAQEALAVYEATGRPDTWDAGNKTRRLNIDTNRVLRSEEALQILRRLTRSGDWKTIRPRGLFPQNAAYLSDLDGTLILSSELRHLCLRRAFVQLLQDDPSFPVLRETLAKSPDLLERCVSLFNLAIYDRADDWRVILDDYPYYVDEHQPKDFRQVWNHQLSYPLLIWVLNHLLYGEQRPSQEIALTISESVQRYSEQWQGEIDTLTKELVSERPEKDVGALRKEAGQKWLNDRLPSWLASPRGRTVPPMEVVAFYREVAAAQHSHKRRFDNAIHSFWDVDFEPLRQTRECLRTLRDVLGFSLYIATEGDYETQLKKIQVCGLSEFFPESVVLCTGSAANPVEDLRIIKDHQREVSDQIRVQQSICNYRTSNARRQRKNNLAFPNVPKDLLRRRDFLHFYQSQWEDFAKKSPGTIYALIVASILVEPKTPFLVLTNLAHLDLKLETARASTQPIRFVMVGDREPSDICPIIQCLEASADRQPPLLTIRLITKDHGKEAVYWNPPADPHNPPRASFVAWSTLQVLLLVSNPQHWSQPIDYDSMPPLISARLALPTGKIADEVYDTLLWGESAAAYDREAVRAFSLINHLAILSTLRDQKIPLSALVQNLSSKLLATEGPGSFAFSVKIVQEIRRFVGNRVRTMAANGHIASLARLQETCRALQNMAWRALSVGLRHLHHHQQDDLGTNVLNRKLIERLLVDILKDSYSCLRSAQKGQLNCSCVPPAEATDWCNSIDDQGLRADLLQTIGEWRAEARHAV